MIYFFTGQPGSGKTTLACRLSGLNNAIIVDGDDLRKVFPETYDEEGRRRNVDRAQTISAFLEHAGWNVCVALIAPYRDQREAFKLNLGTRILEIYLHTIEERGRSAHFVAGYQRPVINFLDLDTGDLTIDECIQKIRSFRRALARIP